MKKLSLFSLLLISTLALAQTPNALSYQAIVRNSSNDLVKNQNVSSRFSILKGSVSGTVVYSETQTQTTNANGLLTSRIGNGTVVSGSLSTVDWSNDIYFIKTETDPNGGSNYSIIGTSQLLSVPYALYAKTSGSSTPGPKGDTGATGPKGDKGDTGLQGVKGDKGDTGSVGAIGATGPKGDTGLQGAKGDKGDTGTAGTIGATGPKGDTGLQGVKGDKGDTGTTGAKGDKGDNGAVGATGPKGDTGLQGAKGDKGDTGSAGAKGDKGDTGNTGMGFANGSAAGQVYLTGSTPFAPQSPVTVSGDVTINSSGSTTIGTSKVTTDKINDGAITIGKLSATGTKDATTYLRGDGTWATPSGGGSSSASGGLGKLVDANNQLIGYVQNINTNNYLVKTSKGFYLTISVDGIYTGSQAYYSDSSCTGAAKFVNSGGSTTVGYVRNGKFLYYEATTGKFFKLKNVNANGVAVAATVSGGSYIYNFNSNTNVGSCGATAGTVGWPVEETETSKSDLGLPGSITLPISVQ